MTLRTKKRSNIHQKLCLIQYFRLKLNQKHSSYIEFPRYSGIHHEWFSIVLCKCNGTWWLEHLSNRTLIHTNELSINPHNNYRGINSSLTILMFNNSVLELVNWTSCIYLIIDQSLSILSWIFWWEQHKVVFLAWIAFL